MNLIESEKIRVSVVGCGRISIRHFDSIKAHEKNIALKMF